MPVGILRFIVMRAGVYRALLAAAFVTVVLTTAVPAARCPHEAVRGMLTLLHGASSCEMR
ncbi:hypothetical protein [Streptomyces cadmiisoli]|uniref:hypothetical protein n=1 Tax=Streptomyces cadmiisoli TaxID=2184053 RepID=UPI00364A8D1E